MTSIKRRKNSLRSIVFSHAKFTVTDNRHLSSSDIHRVPDKKGPL